MINQLIDFLRKFSNRKLYEQGEQPCDCNCVCAKRKFEREQKIENLVSMK
jgi:hypothetical protein